MSKTTELFEKMTKAYALKKESETLNAEADVLMSEATQIALLGLNTNERELLIAVAKRGNEISNRMEYLATRMSKIKESLSKVKFDVELDNLMNNVCNN